MATERTASRVERPERRKRGRLASRSGPNDDATLPIRLYHAIEAERANLSKAASLLACMSLALEHEADFVTGPYYPDLTGMAHDMVRRSIDGLDSLALQQAMLRNTVKEDFCAHPRTAGAARVFCTARRVPGSLSTQQEQTVTVDGLDPLLHTREAGTLQ